MVPIIWQLIDSSSVGGAERHVATLAQSLKRQGYGVVVVLYQRHGANPWLRQLTDAELPVTVLDGRFASLLRAVRRDRPALIHTHGYKSGILGRLAARVAGVPVVSTYHSGERGQFPVAVYDLADDWTGFLGQRIAVSPGIQARLPFRSVVIPSYIIPPERPPTLPLPSKIGFVGRLSHEKAPDLFCELAARAPKGLSWHVYGDGPMRQSLERQFSGTVNFHGIQTDMGRVWSELGLVVMPSRFEGVPLTALEAGAHGVPVLASDVGGLPEVVKHNETGWIFERDDLKQALEFLDVWCAMRTSGDNGKEMRRMCWQGIGERYSEARCLPQVLSVYRAAGWRNSAGGVS